MTSHRIPDPIRTGKCIVCGKTHDLTPRASITKATCSEECSKATRKASIARFRKTEKHAIIQRSFAAKESTKEYRAQWHRDHSQEACDRNRLRFQSDPAYRIGRSQRARLSKFVRRARVGARKGRTLKNLGCTFEQLKMHLEQQFREGMSWDNYGRTGWHIDHKRPINSFDLVLPDGTENAGAFAECFNYLNLQPLWYWENIAKSDNYQTNLNQTVTNNQIHS
jgi:predicted transcriptional regulator